MYFVVFRAVMRVLNNPKMGVLPPARISRIAAMVKRVQDAGGKDRRRYSLKGDWQPGLAGPTTLYRLMKLDERDRLIHNISCSMKGIPERIIQLQIVYFTKADAEWGRRVAEALGVAEPVAVKQRLQNGKC